MNYWLENETFCIKNYDKLPPFSSFLPGLAGIKGIPIWVFYTNRGQGINSFGVNNKDEAIMEFNPANTAYENTSLKGFRTFIKKDGTFFEAFNNYLDDCERTMYINANSVKLVEIDHDKNIQVEVSYYVLPNQNIGALVREVVITNLSGESIELDVLDGMPKIISYGIKNSDFKAVSNLLRSWSLVKNIENDVPYYTLIAASDDSAEVAGVEGGYFYASFIDGQKSKVIYDVDTVFGQDTSLQMPVAWIKNGVVSSQVFENKVPCGFSSVIKTLAPNDTIKINSAIGFAGSEELLNNNVNSWDTEFFADKLAQANELIKDFTNDVDTKTSKPIFDEYIKQTYLDNFLRGGYPYVFGESGKVVHLFSRKHGDPERDYNFFSIAGEFYSQGNGNFRDVCQNRRNDVFFNPQIGDFNVQNFFSLIQTDGFNPLEIRPSTFSIKEECKDEVASLVQKSFENGEVISNLLLDKFTPGAISNAIAKNNILVLVDETEFITQVMEMSNTNLEAGFGEGFWSDHWDYLMDLVENYLLVFPDKSKELLFENKK